MSKGEPIKMFNYDFLVFSPIIYFCQKLVEVVIAWEWEEYGKNSNWAEHPFWKNVFWIPQQVKTQKCMPILPCIHVFLFLTFLELLCILDSLFVQCSSFFPWLGSGFVNVQWLGSLLGVFMLFPHSHGWEFLVFNVAQPMGDISTNLGAEGAVFSHVKP